ncbi:MAG: thiamine diphosphokinase [Bacillota bacterium]|nr:thiamine diphosphokinase [Bacillota bacterium]
MLSVIVLSGRIDDDQICLHWLRQADDIICADGGARHLQRMQFKPHLMIGDLDSVGSQALAWIRSHSVPVERHRVSKDETDAELAMQVAIRRKPAHVRDHGLIVLGALGNRPDHVLATQMLAVRLAEPNRALLLSDGISRIYTLTGDQSLDILMPQRPDGRWIVSVIPMSDRITGLTYTGLEYPLVDAELTKGSTRGVSNRLTASGHSTISLQSGVCLVTVTPED